MYAGKILEIGAANEIYQNPIHPYTKSLLSAVPQPDPISESVRQRLPYVHQEASGPVTMRQVSPNHFVYADDAQFAAWLG